MPAPLITICRQDQYSKEKLSEFKYYSPLRFLQVNISKQICMFSRKTNLLVSFVYVHIDMGKYRLLGCLIFKTYCEYYYVKSIQGTTDIHLFMLLLKILFLIIMDAIIFVSTYNLYPRERLPNPKRLYPGVPT